MTDSITLRIPLTSSAAAWCKAIRTIPVRRRKPGQRIEYFREKVMKSPLSGARMTVLFMQTDANPNTLPNAVVANLNLPSALFGQNYIHECSVPAAANSAFKLLKIVLAQEGVPAEELEKLSVSQSTFDRVTLTLLYEMASPEAADLQMATFGKSLRAMSLTKLRGIFSTNQTLYVNPSDFGITLYNKTNEDSVAWQEGAPKDLIREHGKRLIRLEVVLLLKFLKERGLHLPEAWRGAASNGLYKMLFDETVGKTFRLNDPLRQNSPRQTDLDKLTPMQRELVKSYLAGEDPRQHSNIGSASRPVDTFSKYRLAILGVLMIDIAIPWKRHQDIRHLDLRKALAYPPRYKVDAAVEDWSYCKASSAATHARLDAAFEAAINQAKIRMPNRPSNLLDEED